MRHLALFTAALILSCSLLLAETVTITKSSTQVREKPASKARPLDLVYGNDTYEVLKKRRGWYQIRTARDRVGWILARDAMGGVEGRAFLKPATKVLLDAIVMQRLGYREKAEAKLRHLLIHFPSSYEFYEAARHLLLYSSVGKLPKLKGQKVSKRNLRKAMRMAVAMLKAEAEKLTADKKFLQAVVVYNQFAAIAPRNPDSMKGLHKTLTAFIENSLADPQQVDLGIAVVSFQKYFPTLAVPHAAEVSMKARPEGAQPAEWPAAPAPVAPQAMEPANALQPAPSATMESQEESAEAPEAGMENAPPPEGEPDQPEGPQPEAEEQPLEPIDEEALQPVDEEAGQAETSELEASEEAGQAETPEAGEETEALQPVEEGEQSEEPEPEADTEQSDEPEGGEEPLEPVEENEPQPEEDSPPEN